MEEENKPQSKTEFWKTHLDQWESSGLSAAEYCRRYDLTYLTFLNHRKKQRAPIEADTFVEIPFPSGRLNKGDRLFELAIEPDFHFTLQINFSGETIQKFFGMTDKHVSGDT